MTQHNAQQAQRFANTAKECLLKIAEDHSQTFGPVFCENWVTFWKSAFVRANQTKRFYKRAAGEA